MWVLFCFQIAFGGLEILQNAKWSRRGNNWKSRIITEDKYVIVIWLSRYQEPIWRLFSQTPFWYPDVLCLVTHAGTELKPPVNSL